MRSRVTTDGTAMSEASLCEKHYREPYIGYANTRADAADDVSSDKTWHDSTENDYVTCAECGINESRMVPDVTGPVKSIIITDTQGQAYAISSIWYDADARFLHIEVEGNPS